MIGGLLSHVQDIACCIRVMKVISLPGLRTEKHDMHIRLVLEGTVTSI